MTTAAMTRISAKKALEVCRTYCVHDDIQALLNGDPTPSEYLHLLEARVYLGPALEFLVHALPHRDAVWWTCLCLAVAGRSLLSRKELTALRIAVSWVERPDAKTCHEAYPFISSKSVTGFLAQSVYWGGGNIKAPNQVPALEPTPAMMAQPLYSALLLATQLDRSRHPLYFHREFLNLGRELANGKHLWKNA